MQEGRKFEALTMDPKGDKVFEETFLNALEFVRARKKKSGGFGATPRLPATVEDTYHGLRILASMPPGLRDGFSATARRWPELSNFLKGFLKNGLDLGPRGIFQLLWSMKYCGIELERKRLASVIGGHVLNACRRENLYFAARIALEVAGDLDLLAPDILEKGLNRKISPGILKARMMDLYLDRSLGWHSIPGREAAKWFRECQNPDGGFGFMPGTTSYIENCHYGLYALMLLDSIPEDIQAAFRFIMGCRTISGGFSRNSGAAPFLDATWHAIKGLLLLLGMRKRQRKTA